ncbi:MAG: hypothetical protein HGA19_24900 [Oscillochloris sp.]|nr:hypothetical protein [Oscillochloris sp.]
MSICLLGSAATATPIAAASNSYTWESIHLPTGVALHVVNDLAIDPDDATIIWLSTNTGLYRSTNAGTSWSPVAPSTLSYVRKVIIAPSNTQRIFAISWSVYRSEDGGSTWSAISAPASTCDLVVAPSNAERVYARVCASGQPTLARSDDGGQSWLTPNTLFTTSLDTLVVAPNQPNVLIGGGYATLVRSDNSGASWATVPIGTHYYNQPVFDPQAPYMLYLGHWTGLLRSSNAGLSWEDSHIDQKFSTLIASPISADMVLGGNTTDTWQIQSIQQRWSNRSWDAPTGLQMLWRSANDNTFLYARSSAGLWRYVQQVQPAMPYRVFLPLIRQNNDTTASVAQQALDQANMYRRIARVSDLHIHSTITTAAQNHADYHMANYANSAAWTNGAHGEVAGIPGYTGTWPSNRLAATGYPWSGESSEVMHFIGDPIASVDDWMATIYHRLILLNPDAHYAGHPSKRRTIFFFGSK